MQGGVAGTMVVRTSAVGAIVVGSEATRLGRRIGQPTNVVDRYVGREAEIRDGGVLGHE